MSPKITAKLCERHIVQTYHTRKQKKSLCSKLYTLKYMTLCSKLKKKMYYPIIFLRSFGNVEEPAGLLP